VVELKAAIEAKHSLHHCPVVASLAGIDPVSAVEAFPELRAAGADVVGLNCTGDFEAIHSALAQTALNEPISLFPSAGIPGKTGASLRYPVDAATFASQGEALAGLGVRLIGGCCGTTPKYIAALAERLKMPVLS